MATPRGGRRDEIWRAGAFPEALLACTPPKLFAWSVFVALLGGCWLHAGFGCRYPGSFDGHEGMPVDLPRPAAFVSSPSIRFHALLASSASSRSFIPTLLSLAPFPNHRTWSTVDLDARGPPPGQLHRRYGEDDRPPTPSPRPVRYRAVENGSSSLFAPRETLPGRALVPARVAVAAGNGRRRPRRAVATPDVLHGRGGCEQCDGARRGVRIRTLRCGET